LHQACAVFDDDESGFRQHAESENPTANENLVLCAAIKTGYEASLDGAHRLTS